MSVPPEGPGSDLGREGGYGPEDSPGPRRENPTDLPGMFLLILGILNVPLAGLIMWVAVSNATMSEAAFEEQRDKLVDALRQIGMRVDAGDLGDLKTMRAQNVLQYSIWGGVGLIAAVLTIVGGLRMRALRSYGLAVTGAVLAALPCVSCLGCCGAGEAVGIWALVILLKPEVKARFR